MKAGNNIEEVCNIGNEVLIKEDNTQQITLRVGIIMPLWDGVKRTADTYVMLQMERHQKLDGQLANSTPYNIVKEKNDKVQLKIVDETNSINFLI